jgi:hypothetical protein
MNFAVGTDRNGYLKNSYAHSQMVDDKVIQVQ